MTTTLYPGAIRGAHWYGDQYQGSLMKPNVLVLHTTEGTGIVSYRNGADAPNLTALPDFKTKKFVVYQHFALDRSARALVNAPGGVETNTCNAVQIELIGTCDPAHKRTWGKLKAGVHYVYWPDAPQWAYDALAGLIAWMHTHLGIPLTGPSQWPAYPSSYGKTSARMSHAEWTAFRGVCGHLHVPENYHGDPGDVPFAKILAKAKAIVGKGGSKPSTGGGSTPAPKPAPPFPGASYFGPGKSNSHIKQLGTQLVKRGFGTHYASGPGPKWSDADRKNVADFQRSRKELCGDPDGIPGPLTWRLLFS
ncbi:peptidoglycan-binding protein [Streptomyces sp. NRRL S-920]|uniref:peptidoglycan-binding protein n=1 Tax=Streptomyces sp. NRRL S-920 TaxID=1463921 RepID=UPI0004CAD8F4|nr:peptidoglycan-binding protein [Streptomyces sp. NRRL S-920]